MTELTRDALHELVWSQPISRLAEERALVLGVLLEEILSWVRTLPGSRARLLHQRHERRLSNAGLWCLGRLQTDADRARVLDGLSAARG